MTSMRLRLKELNDNPYLFIISTTINARKNVTFMFFFCGVND